MTKKKVRIEKMSSLNRMWTVSTSKEYFNECEYFDTKEKAIAFGKSYDEFEGMDFYVGEIDEVEMMCQELAIDVIEEIAQQHCNNHGEFAEDYLDDVKREHIEELDKRLENIILDWAKEHDYLPKYFRVNNIEKVINDQLSEV